MASADTLPTDSETKPRQQELVAAVGQMAKVKERWERGERDEITEGFRDAVVLLGLTFKNGDIPRQCRELAIKVFEFIGEFQEFERELDNRPTPSGKFWRAWEAVLDARNKVGAPRFKKLEPIKTLVDKQNLNFAQAAKVYDWYTSNGAPDIEKAIDEYENPGKHTSQIAANPAEIEWEKRTQREIAEVSQRVAEYLEEEDPEDRSPEAPEELDTLIRQKVFAKQIAGMKKISIDAVTRRAVELGIELPDPGTELQNATFDKDDDKSRLRKKSVDPRGVYAPSEPRGVYDPAATPGPGEARGPSDSAAAERISAEISRLHSEGRSSSEIARELGVSRGRVTSVLRSAGESEDE